MPTNLNWLVAGVSACLFAQALYIVIKTVPMGFDFYLDFQAEDDESTLLLVQMKDECENLN